jgi:hypothetical protein
MRSILLQIIREHGYEPRIALYIDGRLGVPLDGIAPDEVGTWLQGFISALPPLED